MKLDPGHETRCLAAPESQPITARLAGTGSLRRELEAVLTAASENADLREIRHLILEANAAGKTTAAACLKVWERLRMRYVLDPTVEEYRAFLAGMRASTNSSQRGLICFLMLARNDRLFREVTLEQISPHLGRDGIPIDVEAVEAAIRRRASAEKFQWTASTVIGIRQHLLGAITDFGVLRGSKTKWTVHPRPGPEVTLFAARLGRLAKLTDRQVLDSCWFRLLGLSTDDVADLLRSAQRIGALALRMQADIVELTLPPVHVS